MNEQSEIHKAWVALKGSVTDGMSEIAPWVNMFHVPGGNFANGEYWITYTNYYPKPYASFVCTAVEFAEYCEMMKEKRMDIIGQNGNDGLHYDNAAQQFESLAVDSKPVFTQAMHESGYFKDGQDVYISQINTLEGDDCNRYFVHQFWCNSGYQKEYAKLGIIFGNKLDAEARTRELLGIKSPREKAIDEMLTISGYVRGGDIEIIVGSIYDAGYRKLTPKHAKMYDDKSHYFGEDYK